MLHVGVLALLVGGVAQAGLLAYAAWNAVALLRRWDLASGSSGQLALERRTYLVSTLVAHALLFELASLFLFVYTADALAPLFTGAMCAAGALAADAWGYPALLLGLANFVLAGLWLVLNRADNLAWDYPLLRRKYGALLLLAPLVVAEVAVRARYFLALRPEVITSCCGSLFSRSSGATWAGLLSELPRGDAAVALYASSATAVAAGVAYRRWPRPRIAGALAAASALALVAGLAGVVAFVSPYVYELPTHRCPFCLLQPEYGGVGYLLYATLLGGAVCGMSVGMLAPLRGVESLSGPLPPFQGRLAAVAAALLLAFLATVTFEVATSHLVT